MALVPISYVLLNIHRGSFSKTRYNRRLGWHSFFDTPFNKAKDPFMNLWTLSRLSHSKNGEVRAAVAENLRNRLSHEVVFVREKDYRFILKSFNVDVVAETFTRLTRQHYNWDNLLIRGFLLRIEDKLSRKPVRDMLGALSENFRDNCGPIRERASEILSSYQ